jgi:DMSO/TMAO reductase YedYZ heme-binding membrane subunit
MVARGAGLAALVLLTSSTVLGAFVSRHGAANPGSSPARRYVLQYLHRALAGLGLAALALHVGTILADPYAHVGWLGALIPFASAYRATAVALGTIATYLLIGVAVLGLARGRIAASVRGARVWRALHGLGYLALGSALWHGVLAGTDSSVGWVRQLYLGCAVAVAASVAVRLFRRPTGRAGDRLAGRVLTRPRQEGVL